MKLQKEKKKYVRLESYIIPVYFMENVLLRPQSPCLVTISRQTTTEN